MWSRGIPGIVLCLIGAVWIAQGTNVLHGSGMSGQGMWAVIGVIVALVGLALLVFAWRARSGAARVES
jgi:hypothetical protein